MQTKFLGSLFIALAFTTTATPATHPLHEAAQRRDKAAIVDLLADSNCNVNAPDEYGLTALMWAARVGTLECLTELLAHDADVTIKDNDGWTPLHHAASLGSLECLKKLIISGADVHATTKNDNTPLHLAAWHCHLTCMEYLATEAGANGNAINKQGKTPQELVTERLAYQEKILKFVEPEQIKNRRKDLVNELLGSVDFSKM